MEELESTLVSIHCHTHNVWSRKASQLSQLFCLYYSAFARKHNLLFIPSVSPGYLDTRIRPWNTKATRSRRKGSYYDLSWRTFQELQGLKIVSITSFNEWHEGTQIEPAIEKSTAPAENQTYTYRYQTYNPHSSDFYMLKTKDWIEKLFLSTVPEDKNEDP